MQFNTQTNPCFNKAPFLFCSWMTDKTTKAAVNAEVLAAVKGASAMLADSDYKGLVVTTKTIRRAAVKRKGHGSSDASGDPVPEDCAGAEAKTEEPQEKAKAHHSTLY